jgi:proton glutamate symport protein
MRIGLGLQVLIALFLGLFFGLFFGPLCNFIKPVGDIYIMLLQMAVLPYICLSLIHGLGSMTPQIGKKLFLKGYPFWIILWGSIFIFIYLLSLLIPKPHLTFVGEGASDGGDTNLAANFFTYLIPQNPFYDLANNIVPAIAIFGLICGVALMHLETKEPLLSLLERSNQIIEKIFKWLAILSPIGIFSHIAVASGTVYFDDLQSLQFYVISFIFLTLFMIFWILPAILCSFTSLTYKQVMEAFRIVCLLPFATALPSISIPFILIYMKKLGERQPLKDSHFHATSQTVMPICYSFGQIGNCLILFFILFLSFYYRQPLVGSEKALLSILTIPMSIGSSATSINAVSFLIRQLHFPNEAIELFTQTMAVTLNFQVLLSIASVLTFIILVFYAYYGLLQVRWTRLSLHFLLAIVFFGGCIGLGKKWIHIADSYQNLYLDLKVADVIAHPVFSEVLPRQSVESRGEDASGAPKAEPLELILKTGVLRVGFSSVDIPYSYWNQNHELAGFDISYAYELAKDLDCTLEFIPIDFNTMAQDLEDRKYDIGMGAIIMTEDRIKRMDFTHTYTEQDNVLIVPMRKRSQYTHLEKVLEMPHLKIGAIGGNQSAVRRHFPQAELIESNDYSDLLEGRVEAWMSTRTQAFIWCLAHPEFVVIDYGGQIGKRYFAYTIPNGSVDWASFLNNWLTLKIQSGFKEQMYNYWILGENPTERAPRWSILRNLILRPAGS